MCSLQGKGGLTMVQSVICVFGGAVSWLWAVKDAAAGAHRKAELGWHLLSVRSGDRRWQGLDPEHAWRVSERLGLVLLWQAVAGAGCWILCTEPHEGGRWSGDTQGMTAIPKSLTQAFQSSPAQNFHADHPKSIWVSHSDTLSDIQRLWTFFYRPRSISDVKQSLRKGDACLLFSTVTAEWYKNKAKQQPTHLKLKLGER